MTATRAVHQCLFCPQIFGSAAEKDDHTLEHFAQEKCTECNQNLIRIGGNLYIQHNAATCIKLKFKTETHFEPCYVEQLPLPNEQQNNRGDVHPINSGTIIVDEFQVKVEIESECQLKESINQFEVANKLRTSECGDVTGGQSDDDDERILPDENGWVDSDSSMDSNRFGESSTKNESILPCEQQATPAFASRNNPNGQMNQDQSNEQKNFNENELKFTHEQPDSFENLQMLPLECELLLQKAPKWTPTQSHFCEICASTFPTAEELNKHISECYVRKQDGSIECGICKKSLSSMRTLKQHKLLKHTPAETHVCRRCAKVFLTANKLEKHRVKCILKWKNRIDTNKSINPNATFECYLCKVVCRSFSSLFAHMRWKHNLNNIKYKCKICGMGFFAKSLQEMHLRRHNEPLSDRKVMCNVCGKFLTKGYSLKNHMKVHSGYKPFECPHEGCDKSFATKSAARIHIRSHNPEDRLKCPHEGCSKSFLSKPSLTIHLRSHSGEKPFRCPHEGCNKSFVTKNVIPKHMLIHTGEKPFKCLHDGCEKEFRTKGARDRHMGTNAHK